MGATTCVIDGISAVGWGASTRLGVVVLATKCFGHVANSCKHGLRLYQSLEWAMYTSTA